MYTKSFDFEIQNRACMLMIHIQRSDELILLEALSMICYVPSGYN
jgi:hypothetical protein